MNFTTRSNESAHTPSFTFTMSISIHEIFTELVVQEIWSQLKKIAREENVAEVANAVRSQTNSDAHLNEHGSIKKGDLQRSPDASFAHADSQYPSVIIEIAYSQRRKDLVRLADEYICESDGSISVVLRLDIAYGHSSKRPSISI